MMPMNIFKVAGIFDEMDVLARAQFLEGYLKIRPFGKIRGAQGKSALLKSILHMMAEAGAVSEEWASKGDTGLYRSTFMAVNKAIRSQHQERTTEAADLLQSMMGLTGWETEEGETVELGGKSPFWLAGKYAGEKNQNWLAEGMIPNDAAGLSVRLAQRRALDVLRQEADRAKKREENLEDIVDETMSQSDSDDADWGSVIDTIFANSSHPLSKKFFSWLYERVPQVLPRVRAQVMLQYLDLLRSGQVEHKGTGEAGKGGGDSEAARLMGLTPQDLWNAKKVFMDKMSAYITSHPEEQQQLQDMFSDASFMRDLFRGTVRAARLRMARQIVSRFLAMNAGKTAARKDFKFKKDVKLKSGETIAKDAKATVAYDGKTDIASVTVEGIDRPVRLSIKSLTVLLDGYPKMPSLSRLEKMDSDGIATTPTGARVEPDGYGPDGAPSWLIVAGVI